MQTQIYKNVNVCSCILDKELDEMNCRITCNSEVIISGSLNCPVQDTLIQFSTGNCDIVVPVQFWPQTNTDTTKS